MDDDLCPANALTLQRNLSKEEYQDLKSNPKYIVIKIKSYWLNQRNGDIYQTVRSSWKLSLNRAKKYPYVLAVVDGIVSRVFKVIDWHYANNHSGRIEFDGIALDSDDEIAKLFLDKKIPSRFRQKGQANPAMYSD